MRLVIEIHFDDGTPTATATATTAQAGPPALIGAPATTAQAGPPALTGAPAAAPATVPATSPPFTPVVSISTASDGGSPAPTPDDPGQV